MLRFLHKKQCSVRFYLQLFVGGCMSYLRYLCVFAHRGVKHILCCVFALLVFVLCTQCCKFLWIVHSWWPIWFSLTFIYRTTSGKIFKRKDTLMFLQFYNNALVYTNPTTIRCQDYQIHLRNLSILDRNQFFHFVFFEWPAKKV